MKELLNKKFYDEDFGKFLEMLLDTELLLAFNGNHLLEMVAGDKTYIPLFTDEEEVNTIYTRLDKVKLGIVIKDIYSIGKYHAITINPHTNDFIIGKNLIRIIESLI